MLSEVDADTMPASRQRPVMDTLETDRLVLRHRRVEETAGVGVTVSCAGGGVSLVTLGDLGALALHFRRPNGPKTPRERTKST